MVKFKKSYSMWRDARKNISLRHWRILETPPLPLWGRGGWEKLCNLWISRVICRLCIISWRQRSEFQTIKTGLNCWQNIPLPLLPKQFAEQQWAQARTNGTMMFFPVVPRAWRIYNQVTQVSQIRVWHKKYLQTFPEAIYQSISTLSWAALLGITFNNWWFLLLSSVVDPDPHWSGTFPWIRIRNYCSGSS